MRMSGFLLSLSLLLSICPVPARSASLPGEAAFLANCSQCHPSGGNTIAPAKNLRVVTLQANGIRTVQDIVQTMRRPGPGMPPFDSKALTERQAREIAEYILATFK
jgi:cytochrome c6